MFDEFFCSSDTQKGKETPQILPINVVKFLQTILRIVSEIRESC